MNRTDPLDLVTTGVAVGGAGIARDGDGRVVFVEGALVGERVSVEIVETKKSFRRGRVLDVLEPAPGRVLPSCPEIANGCGGCDLAHASHAAQREMKAAMVADSLRRLGRLADLPDIDPGPDLTTTGFRTTIRAAVVDGRAGLRHRRSHDVVTVASCEVAHPVVEGMLVNGRYGDADEVTIRVGADTGEQAVFVGGSEPDEGTVIHEEIAGRRFRISPRSFFQTRADGAAALVSVVD
ncbi:MAG TPA: TRAM domain-containing protein, partial [Microthrixaceae bacterium]|nr:TRAM domain-containing protein [Microthrixaceae bacterium]